MEQQLLANLIYQDIRLEQLTEPNLQVYNKTELVLQ
jgi:hypothetical protein